MADTKKPERAVKGLQVSRMHDPIIEYLRLNQVKAHVFKGKVTKIDDKIDKKDTKSKTKDN